MTRHPVVFGSSIDSYVQPSVHYARVPARQRPIAFHSPLALRYTRPEPPTIHTTAILIQSHATLPSPIHRI